MFEKFQPKILRLQSRPNNNLNSSSQQYGSKMELRRKTTWESSLNKIKTETYKSHNLQPLACPTTEGNSENKIKTETYKSHNLHPSFLPPTTTKYFPTHAVDLVIIDEAHHYSARTKKNNIAFLQRKRKKVKPII